MVIVGAALNHWYHNDMIYRGIINMLMMCGCVINLAAAGRTMLVRKIASTVWLAPLAFASDWTRPPRRRMAPASSMRILSQWRHEKPVYRQNLGADCRQDEGQPHEHDRYECQVGRYMGWLPSAPQLETNPF